MVLQSICALFTTKAGYMVLTKASKEEIWLCRLANKFGINQDLVMIMSDTQRAICLVKN